METYLTLTTEDIGWIITAIFTSTDAVRGSDEYLGTLPWQPEGHHQGNNSMVLVKKQKLGYMSIKVLGCPDCCERSIYFRAVHSGPVAVGYVDINANQYRNTFTKVICLGECLPFLNFFCTM